MALSLTQQTFELIKKSNSILIAVKRDWSGDALASALACAEILKKLGKQAEIVCEDFRPAANLNFLPTAQIKTRINQLQKFIISIDTSKSQVGEFYYDNSKDKLNIYVTPKEGQFNPSDVSMSASNYKYDLIITINTPDLESLGSIYLSQADFFYAIAKINIDHSNKNEYYGNVDLVNLAASSCAEIIYDFVKEIDEELIDENVATYLLAGIIMATKNFKSNTVTPKTLNLASLLIAKGARREQIIQCLYQNRFLSTLKLWGRVLYRLNNDLDDKIVWSVLSAQDFLETSTEPGELFDVIEELILSMPKTEIIALIYEVKNPQRDEISAIIYSTKNVDALAICQKFDASGNKEMARFSLPNTTLAEAERIIISEIKQRI